MARRFPFPVRAALAWALAGCATTGFAERSIQGQLVSGPQVDAQAYAHATMAASLEASHQPAEALQHFASALTLAPADPFLLARVGNLQCNTELAMARDSFAKAEAYSPGYAGTQIHYARCLERHGHFTEALKRAEHAVQLMPSSAEASRVWSRLLLKSGQPRAAAHVRRAFALLYPEAVISQQEAQFATVDEQSLLSDWVAYEQRAPGLPSAGSGTVDEQAKTALARGSLARARQLLRYIADSSPQDATRQALALRTANLLQDRPWASHLLRRNRVSPTLSCENAEAHRQLLEGWVGQFAARSWSSAYRQAVQESESEHSDCLSP